MFLKNNIFFVLATGMILLMFYVFLMVGFLMVGLVGLFKSPMCEMRATKIRVPAVRKNCFA